MKPPKVTFLINTSTIGPISGILTDTLRGRFEIDVKTQFDRMMKRLISKDYFRFTLRNYHDATWRWKGQVVGVERGDKRGRIFVTVSVEGNLITVPTN